MEIIHLINETYQVIDNKGNVLFQGKYHECQLFEMKDNPFFREFLNLFNT
jgi:hypothetical protein